jgi:hypothetical protein
MFLVSKWVNNQWKSNKVYRNAPDNAVRNEIYGELGFYVRSYPMQF